MRTFVRNLSSLSRAILILFAVMLVVLVVEAMFQSQTPSVAALVSQAIVEEKKAPSTQGSALLFGDSGAVGTNKDSDLLGNILGEVDVSSDIPTGFQEELFSLAGYENVLVSSDGKVVGVLAQEAPEFCFDRCAKTLKAQGWTLVESGQANAASCYKSTGTYTSAYMSVTAVGKESALVVQLVQGSP